MKTNKNITEDGSSIISKIFFLWAGKYINKAKNNGDTEEPLKTPKKYAINTIEKKYDKFWSNHDFTKKNYVKCVLKSLNKSFLLYVILSIVSILMAYVTPILFPLLTQGISDKGIDTGYWLKLISVFFATQVLYSLFKTQFTHMKWKLITSVEFNGKNYILKRILFSDKKEVSKFTSGQLLNFYSGHTSNLRGIVWTVDFFANIIGIIIGMIVLGNYIGIGGVIGGITLLIASPLISKIMKKMNRYEKEIHKHNDVRLSIMSEIINKIREIKLVNFQSYFNDKVMKVREEQSDLLLKKNKVEVLFNLIASMLIPIITFSSILISIFIFRTDLSAANVLASFIVFNILDGMINQIFISLNSIRSCYKSLDFIIEFYNNTNICELKKTKEVKGIELDDASYSDGNKTLLDKINLKIRKNELVSLTGTVGSGKSILLKAIAGYYKLESGCVETPDNIVVISEDSWFLPMTIKENIILNKQYDESLYLKALELSELKEDLEGLSLGDNTVIIENGKNLSGGQAIRLQIARAIYKNPDVILMDNVLNSLDINIRKRIINNVLLNYWNNKIRIIISKDYDIVKNSNYIVEMADKKIKYIAKWDTYKESYIEEHNEASEIKSEKHKAIIKNDDKASNQTINKDNKGSFGKLLLVNNYIKKLSNTRSIIIFFLLFALSQIIDIMVKMLVTSINDGAVKLTSFTVIYFILILFSMGSNCLRYCMVYIGNVKAGKKYHSELTKNFLNVNYKYYDNNFIKRATAVYSNDIRVLDNYIGDYFINVFQAIIYMAATLIMVFISSWKSLAFILLFIAIFFSAQKVTRIVTNIIVKKCNESNEPCFELINSIYDGINIINSYMLHDYIKEKWNKCIERAFNYEYSRQSINRYELLKIDMAGTLLIVLFLLGARFSPINADFMSVTLTYLITTCSGFEGMLRNIRHAEIGIASLERIEQFNNLVEKEDNECSKYNDADTKIEGITVNNINCDYGTGKSVINNLSLEILKGENILIQGRTGIGKTTFFNCLTRLIDYSGDIYIDGVNIKNIPLDILRKKIFVLTQNDAIFSGTIRENLDPYNKFGEDTLKKVMSIFKLSYLEINMTCDKLSSGERQLLCLIRAYLNKAEILLIDEGMAQIDKKNSKDIYDALQNLFEKSTIIGISHNDDNTGFYNRKIELKR